MSEPITSGAFFRRLRTTRFSLLVIAFIVCLTASARGWLAPASKAEPSLAATKADAANSVPPPGNSSQERVEVEIITMRSTGFEPSEITRPAGRFFLMFENHSGLDAINLRLDREHGGRLHSVRLSREEQEWTDLFDLQPSQYLLTEAEHSDWVCRITITAR